MAVSDGLDFVADIVADVGANLSAHAAPLAAYTAGWFGVSWALQVVGPVVAPRLYGAINPDGKMSGAAVAKDMRTKLLCSGMAVWVVGWCIYGLLSAEGRALYGHHYATSPLTQHLALFAASFFVWDIVICIVDGEAAAYHFHAWACFLTFIHGLHPFSQYMSQVVLLFEASTPFLHARKFMLQAGYTTGAWATPFMVVQASFAVAFFVSRILVGYVLVGAWALDLVAGLQAGTLHNPSVVKLYLGMSTALCALNGFWFFQIAQAAVRGSTPGAHVPVNIADDLTSAIDGNDSPAPADAAAAGSSKSKAA